MKTLLARTSALFVPAILGLLALAGPRAGHASPGDLDRGFGTGGKVITKIGSSVSIDQARSMAVQADGKILVVGYVSQQRTGVSPNGSTATTVFAVARYHGKAATGTPGTLDTGFGTGGIVTTQVIDGSRASSVAVQADGKIVVVGATYSSLAGNTFAMVRYHGNAATGTPGTLDTGFGNGGIAVFRASNITSVALQADGKIVVAGDSNATFTVARYHGDAATGTPGTLDSGFGTGGTVSVLSGSLFGGCSSMALQADGRIVLAGFVRTPTGPGASNPDFAVARLHGDAATGTPGTLDTGFGTGGVVVTDLGSLGSTDRSADFANSVAVQADGKIVVGGVTGFEDMAVYKVGLVRYHGDAATGTPGALDAGFGTGGIVITDVGDRAEGVNGVALQADGKIVVAGYADISTSEPSSYTTNFLLARYHGDVATGAPGTLDTGFGTGGIVLTDLGGMDTGNSVALQPDGKIVVAGTTYDFNSLTTPANGFALARYLGGTGVVTPGRRDLNGDGNEDIVLQDASGAVFGWNLDGAGVIDSAGFIYNGPVPGWTVVGVADLNHDGHTDIILQHTGGSVFVWYRDGSGAIASSGFIYNGPLLGCRVAGVADVNNDGNQDIVLQYSTGAIFVWYLNSSGGIDSSRFIYSGALSGWTVVGVADMNNDGNADIVFQQPSGAVSVWHLNGAGVIGSSRFIYNGAVPGWRVAGVADLNNDGNQDIFLQFANGSVFVWYLDGAGAIDSWAFLYNGPVPGWLAH